MRFFVFVFLVFGVASVVSDGSDLVFETPLGQIRGSLMSSASGREFRAFRGIPYAKPPIGELRFKEPESADPWTGVFDASRDGPTCIQFDFMSGTKGTEDCLVLNIYTHQIDSNTGSRPVLVWIHGGGWLLGSGSGESDQFGPDFFMDRDIVLVTINYRLGPIGFFSTEDEEAPGNYGLLDQTLALQWVRSNIKYFGGDDKSVTIFGASVGGASVHYHTLSPYSKGLFDRAIIQSGSALCPWSTLEAVGKYSKKLAQFVQCPTTPSRDLVACLRSKPADQIISYFGTLVMEIGQPVIVFGPRVDLERDRPFLPQHPRNILQEAQFHRVPLIFGMNENEGLSTLAAGGLLTGNAKQIEDFHNDPLTYTTYLIGLQDDPNGKDITQRALDHYFHKDQPFEQQLIELDQLMTDYGMGQCVDEAVRYHSGHVPVFSYLYSHRGQYTIPRLLGAVYDFGVSHADEMMIMFQHNLLPPLSSPDDLKMSKIFMDLWTSFAKDGEPRSEDVDQWPSSTREEPRHLKLNVNPSLHQGRPYHERLLFWDQLLQTTKVKDEL